MQPTTRATLVLALALGCASTACRPQTRAEVATPTPTPTPPADAAPIDDWRVVPLGDRIWAALQPAPRRFDDSNSLIVAGEDAALVVDAQASLERTRALIERTRALIDVPVRWLVNTHWHGDHTAGNSAWLEAYPGLTIVGHSTVRADVVERAMPDHRERIGRWDAAIEAAVARLAEGVDRDGAALDEAGRTALAADIDDARRRVAAMREIRAELPALALDGAATIRLGGRRVELHPFRAHTRGDVVVLVPDARVLATGDLLDDLPFGGHGYPTSWLGALDRIDAFEFDSIVPGHGPVLRGRAKLELTRRLLRLALDGLSLEHPAMVELRESFVGDDPVAARSWDGFVGPLLERVVAERAGSLD